MNVVIKATLRYTSFLRSRFYVAFLFLNVFLNAQITTSEGSVFYIAPGTLVVEKNYNSEEITYLLDEAIVNDPNNLPSIKKEVANSKKRKVKSQKVAFHKAKTHKSKKYKSETKKEDKNNYLTINRLPPRSFLLSSNRFENLFLPTFNNYTKSVFALQSFHSTPPLFYLKIERYIGYYTILSQSKNWTSSSIRPPPKTNMI